MRVLCFNSFLRLSNKSHKKRRESLNVFKRKLSGATRALFGPSPKSFLSSSYTFFPFTKQRRKPSRQNRRLFSCWRWWTQSRFQGCEQNVIHRWKCLFTHYPLYLQFDLSSSTFKISINKITSKARIMRWVRREILNIEINLSDVNLSRASGSWEFNKFFKTLAVVISRKVIRFQLGSEKTRVKIK